MNFTQLTIVLNGAFWIEENIRSLYDQTDRIVVVEGASLEVPRGRGSGLRLTGGSHRSTDGTVEILQQLEKELPKLRVIYATRPWRGKTEMCNVALGLCLPGWIVQRDVDEFFFPEEFEIIKATAKALPPDVGSIDFWAFHFWPDIDHHCILKDGEWGNNPPWKRFFRFNPQTDRWSSHEPPILGNYPKTLDRNTTSELGVVLMHFGYVTRHQFEDRERFYALPIGCLLVELDRFEKTGEAPRSLVRYKGTHPLSPQLLAKIREAQ
jgi:glycosyltransferase involved in cell wall biosynthesis